MVFVVSYETPRWCRSEVRYSLQHALWLCAFNLVFFTSLCLNFTSFFALFSDRAPYVLIWFIPIQILLTFLLSNYTLLIINYFTIWSTVYGGYLDDSVCLDIRLSRFVAGYSSPIPLVTSYRWSTNVGLLVVLSMLLTQ